MFYNTLLLILIIILICLIAIIIIGQQSNAIKGGKPSKRQITIYLQSNNIGKGIIQDAEVVKEAISSQATIKSIKLQEQDEADIAIHIEHIFPNVKAKTHIWIPNQELITDWDMEHINKMNHILCKTHETKQVITDLLKQTHQPNKPKIHYTGFTSLQLPYTDTDDKDKDLIIHVGGTSPMKNSDHIMKAWINSKGFIDINKDIKLLVVKKTKLANPSMYNIAGREIMCQKIEPNIYLIDHIDDLTYFISKANIALCCSVAEGYGHSINEARMVGSIPVTIDKPPMSELVPFPQLQISASPNGRVKDILPTIHIDDRVPSTSYDFDDSDFIEKIRSLLMDNSDNLNILRTDLRSLSDKERESFNKAISDLLEEL